MKKLSYNSLAFKTVLHRRKQYILLTVGIVLALVFSSGIVFLGASLNTSLDEIARQNYTKANLIFTDRVDGYYDRLQEAPELGTVAAAECLCALSTPETPENRYTLAAVYSEEALELAYPILEEGRLPEKAGEIAIERDALQAMRLTDAAAGDEIELLSDPCSGDSLLGAPVKKTYTLTGILKDKRRSFRVDYGDDDGICAVFPAAILSPEETVEPGGRARMIAFASAKDEIAFRIRFWEDIYLPAVGDRSTEDRIVILEGCYSHGLISYFMALYTGASELNDKAFIAKVLSAVLTAASMCGIISAFNTNLSERKKQLGMLRAVGATKRQIFRIHIREAFFLCLISIPASLAISYFAVKLILTHIDENFLFVPDLKTLLFCALAGFAAVMTAASLPLIRVSAASPMQAIRGTDPSRKMRKKHIRSEEDFKPSRLLAKRNLSFSFLKRAGVAVLLALTVCISCFGFAAVKNQRENYYSMPFDYILTNAGDPRITFVSGSVYNKLAPAGKAGFSDSDINALLSVRGVGGAEKKKSANALMHIAGYTDYYKIISSMKDDFRFDSGHVGEMTFDGDYDKLLFGKEHGLYTQTQKAAGTEDDLISVSIVALSEKQLSLMKDRVTEGKIDLEKLKSGEEVLICAPKMLGLECRYKKDGSGFRRIDEVDPNASKKKLSSYTMIGERDLSVGGELTFTCLNSPYTEDGQAQARDGGEIAVTVIDGEEVMTATLPADLSVTEKKTKIGAFVSIDDSPFLFGGYLTVYTSSDAFPLFGCEGSYSSVGLTLDRECDEVLDNEITAEIQALGAGSSWRVQSQYANKKAKQDEARLTLLVLVSFITLTFTVSAGMINNDLSASIREDKKQIGTLRAVGASLNEITKSYVYRFLGVFGLGVGSGFALYLLLWGLYQLLHKITDITLFSMPLEFHVLEALGICTALFLVCAGSLRIRLRRLTRDSIVDNIREL